MCRFSSLFACFALFFFFFFFFFNDPATTEIYTLSLHDALPIFNSKISAGRSPAGGGLDSDPTAQPGAGFGLDRKSTRLNSSHSQISYAVFCLKKKKKKKKKINTRKKTTK